MWTRRSGANATFTHPIKELAVVFWTFDSIICNVITCWKRTCPVAENKSFYFKIVLKFVCFENSVIIDKNVDLAFSISEQETLEPNNIKYISKT
jgi:hypothetical protein